MRDAIGEIESQIKNLRALITDLRPAALDDLGLRAALRALIERHRHDGLSIVGELDLSRPPVAGEVRLLRRFGDDGLPACAGGRFRRTSSKHARSSQARIVVTATDEDVTVEVQDDGEGSSLWTQRRRALVCPECTSASI